MLLHPPSLQLTIDDGPYQFITPQILKILGKHNIKATFFLIGHQANLWQDSLNQIHAEGHLIGNHSYTHRPFTQLTEWQIRHEIRKTEESLRYLNTSRLFRPPYGAHDQRTDDIMKDMAYTIMMWDTSIEQFQDIDANTTIILAHQTQWLIDNLDGFITNLKEKFKFG